MISLITHTQTHAERVRSELKEVGVSSVALRRFTARYLPKVIHENERIEAAVFGHHKESEALFGFAEGILVATNLRVIYLDHKPGFTTLDEVAYDVISGVNISSSGLYSSLTLFTKVGNYTISFANLTSIKKFADYIESQRIDSRSLAKPEQPTVVSKKAEDATSRFLREHDTAVLSTIERGGNVTSAVVFYVFSGGYMYILTKDGTRKARNMMVNDQVALVIYDTEDLQTVQMQGMAEVELDPAIKQSIYERLAKPDSRTGSKTPPVTKIQEGSFVVFRITPLQFSFSDFSH